MSAEEQHHHDDHDHGHDEPSTVSTVIASPGSAGARSTSEGSAESIEATPEHGFWRSVRELEGLSILQTDRSAGEFPDNASEPGTVAEGSLLQRRSFFQLMGASMALAGVGACQRYEKEEIVPLARRPEDQVPGQTQQYATVFDLGGAAQALLATAFEGRPIKIDGNPDHPFAAGAVLAGTQRHAGSSTFAQASILNLYDPDRSQQPLSNGQGTTFDAVKATIAALAGNLAGLRVLSEATSSPTVQALKAQLVGKGVMWHEYEPLSWDNERVGMREAFGRPVRPIAKLDQALTIVTIDADLFVEHPCAMRYNRDFAKSRQRGASLPDGQISRLWSVESTYTHAGAMADHRLPLRTEHGLVFAQALDAAFGGGAMPDAAVLKEAKVQNFLGVLVEELRRNQRRAVVVAGRRQPPAVHAIVARINQALGAVGATLEYYEDPEPNRDPHVVSIGKLAEDIKGGKVKNLVILGGNPVYDAPADLGFGALLAGVNAIHLSEYVNETSQVAKHHIPKAHYLEAWGDARTWDGTVTLAQPIIAPLYGGLSSIELLALLAGGETNGRDLVSSTHEAMQLGGNWRKNVHDGYVAGSQLPLAAGLQVRQVAAPQLTPTQQAGSETASDVEVTFNYSPFAWDGRFANNAWLQETPDFFTKVTWDNYALVSPATAKRLNLANDTMITVKVGASSITVPCYTMPGQAAFSIGLVLGGGRTAAGRVGGTKDRTVGVNAYTLRTVAGFDAARGSVSPTGDGYELASVQEHWDMRKGLIPSVTQDGIKQRLPELIKQVTADDLKKNPAWDAEGGIEQYWDDTHVTEPGKTPRHLSLFREHAYEGRKWAMAIDLSTCTGCNACMVACQAENNVPVVGRTEVMNNREMHWIRIDRYFSGSMDDPQIVHQPVACQQCENAPCEQVCPVGATSHSSEGLNDMAYNRCIGTRYCANNCPYKVRRFNFLDWNKEWREARNKVRRLLFNPEVTVRMRGVMEKCTFCVQRIQNAGIHARAEIRTGQRDGSLNGPLPDGEITTACQQACPTEAIVFGDLSDPHSRVSKLHQDQRAYDLLPETYTRPRNRFLTRIRNPNPDPRVTAPKAPDAHGHGAPHGAAPAAPVGGGHK